MQQVTFTTAPANQATYTNAIVKKEAIQKIIVFTAMLTCFVLAVNI
ncbi:MAG: hypothetical protein KDC07_02650 [Chitinophagaceae bacterium]|nr:hypothetical protein [Chitinophagaceae bacterium]MCB9046058.1 hypothetical protein [Chitinophagales bacterium]